MNDRCMLARRLLATSALAALLVSAPWVHRNDLGGLTMPFGAASAFAKGDDSGGHGGDDSGGHGGDDSGGHGGDDSGSHGGGNSGGGGGNDSGGSSGDDSSGRGGGDSGGRGSDDSGGSSGDDSGGRSGDDSGGRSGDDSGGRGSDDSSDRSGDDRSGGTAGIERDGDKIEVTFADGSRQEIDNGRFEAKDPQGRTIAERSATAEDRARLGALGSGDAARTTAVTGGTRVEMAGSDIEVVYGDGWREEITDGRYELKDPNNDTVVERRALDQDRTRLESALER